jgi:hypothetical protein
MTPITKDELDKLGVRAVMAGQMQLASIMSSLSVLLEHNEPRVMHELAHVCAEHVAASRSTHGHTRIEGAGAFRGEFKPHHHSEVHTNQAGIAEEPLRIELVLNQPVSVKDEPGKYYNGRVIKIPDSEDPDIHVKLDKGDQTSVAVKEVYAPR